MYKQPKSQVVLEKNTGMSEVQNSGFQTLKQRIDSMMQAGKRLVQHRIDSQLIDVDGEEIESSLFGLKRYPDKLDICELIMSNRDKIAGVMSTYNMRKAVEAAEKAKKDLEDSKSKANELSRLQQNTETAE